MSRYCDICGNEIGPIPGICKNCGMAYSAEGTEDSTTFGNPRWGLISINFVEIPFAGRAHILDSLARLWKNLEERTAQKLFPGQLARSEIKDKVELYGPYSSYLEVKRLIFGMGMADPNLVIFSDKAIDEIYRIRDRSYRAIEQKTGRRD